MIDSEPPSASWASNVSACWVSASTRVTPTLIATAIADAEPHLGQHVAPVGAHEERDEDADDQRGLEPSRKPIRKLPSTASP
jgi:hypothetical protein